MKLWEMVKSLEEKVSAAKKPEFLWLIEYKAYDKLLYLGPFSSLDSAMKEQLEILGSTYTSFSFGNAVRDAEIVRFKRDNRD